MAIYTNLPIYKASYTLMLSVSKILPSLPRDCRYTFGQDVRQKIMEIITLIYRANRVRTKVSIISKMRETLLEVQVYIRLMNDMKYISIGKYTDLMEQTADMSKQMSAWEKSEIQKYSDDNKAVADKMPEY
ncbi:MAG: four helix bundle protein [Bacteroidales bacterium]|nr:four helix bundle protein [Bacteroidales bacterium]MDD2205444.1 four helix bundle protein [Bacteroidales bacterium]MDD3152704.1 four helix bundle protein [Bacteroidales bacterium]MDD3914108.1 four helix bundle protein [Bacteroidales bacterium]MDD4634060.1 four helix bundle protein [Bacteroidales bacterium]